MGVGWEQDGQRSDFIKGGIAGAERDIEYNGVVMAISPSPQPSPSGRGGTCREKVNALREKPYGMKELPMITILVRQEESIQ